MFIFPLPPQGRHKGEKRPKRRCGVGFSDFMVLLPPEEDSFFISLPAGEGKRLSFSLCWEERRCISLLPAEGTLFSPLLRRRDVFILPSARWEGNTKMPET